MELSGNAKRAMELVERNLSILYGADYFTEEEWIKFDGLLHKGRYVLSDGPANNILDAPLNNILDVPLMTFEESKDDIKDTVVEIPPDESFCQTRSDSMVASEESVSSPPSEHGDSLPSPPDHTSEAPVETSDEDSCSRRTSTAELGPEPGSEPVASDSTEPTTVRSAEPEHKPETKSLPPSRYTQEQLDEVRAFNAGLTKAGHKARPKYNHVEDDCSSEWIEEYNEPSGEERSYPSPPPTERLARINTWAGGVAKLPPLPPSHVESPTPNRSLPIAPAVEVLAEQFIKAHGRPHKSLNDFYQPNNPNHQLKRPKSQTSMKTTKTFATLRSAAPSAIEQIWNASPANGIVLGNVYTAQSGAPQRGIRFEVRPGDHIKVTKYVSGIMYIGENLRSKERGQFPESIFQRGSSSSHRSVIAERAAPSFQRGLDQIENANAAEWDDVASIKRPEPAAPISRPHLGGGLAASKFSTADRTPPRQSTQAQRGNIESDMAGQIEQIINDKVEEILNAREVAPTPQIPTTAPKGLQPVQPKTEICWYWSVKNDCRFTAAECRDLHAYLPNGIGESTNLCQGKPAWGALADSLPPLSPNTQPSNLGVIGDGLKVNSKTCYYWAVTKNCTNTAEGCKYLHEYSPYGVAAKPGYTKPAAMWKREWRSQRDQEEAEAEGRQNDNERVLEEVQQEVEVDGWGQPIQQSSENAWGDDTYKTPHVSALEERVAQSAAGW